MKKEFHWRIQNESVHMLIYVISSSWIRRMMFICCSHVLNVALVSLKNDYFSPFFVVSHGVVWVPHARHEFPPCCHTTCLHPPGMVGVWTSGVSFSSPSAYHGGSVGCVSSLSSPQWMMWPVLVKGHSCFLSSWGMASLGYAHLSCLKAAMIWWAWFVHGMRLWRKAVPLTPVSSNTHFLSAQAQSSVE